MPSLNKLKLKQIINKDALSLGFNGCGIAKAGFLENEAPRFEKWLKSNHNAGMAFMENNFDKRLNPLLLFEGTKSVISLIYNYNTNVSQNPDSYYTVARFALLNDYHFFLKQKMTELVNNLRNIIGNFNASCYVDSAPIVEKAWAVKSGLGCIAKNSQLIIPGNGSRFFLCEILTDLEPEYDFENKAELCGSCNKCIKACPTAAINSDRTINANKCIAYMTIEQKDGMDISLKNKFNKQIFGCDICLDACPYNNYSENNTHAIVNLNENIIQMNKSDWENMTKDDFKNTLRSTSLFRTGYKKIKKNINFLLKN